jgi:hypothetical protein
VIGIRPTKAIIRVAILPIRSPSEGDWEKIAKLIELNSHKGMKSVVTTVTGFLKIGRWKWAFEMLVNLSFMCSFYVSYYTSYL